MQLPGWPLVESMPAVPCDACEWILCWPLKLIMPVVHEVHAWISRWPVQIATGTAMCMFFSKRSLGRTEVQSLEAMPLEDWGRPLTTQDSQKCLPPLAQTCPHPDICSICQGRGCNPPILSIKTTCGTGPASLLSVGWKPLLAVCMLGRCMC
jgi:hypothetical protein